MDRGSTHHIMSDLESLSFHQPYDGATYLWVNPFFHSRIKHVALDYQFIRNQVKSCTLRVVHVSTEDQLADAMTKPLPYPTFISFAGKIGVFRTKKRNNSDREKRTHFEDAQPCPCNTGQSRKEKETKLLLSFVSLDLIRLADCL